MNPEDPKTPPLPPSGDSVKNPTPPPADSPPPLSADIGWAGLFENLLKKPGALIASFTGEGAAGALSGKLLALAALSLAVFGLTLGTFAMHEQLWAAPLKLVTGLLLAALICLPSLYIFTALTGTRLGFLQLARGLCAMLALTGAILIGFAPVLRVFAQSTDSLGFMGFLVLMSWLIAYSFGAGFLVKMLKASGKHSTAPLNIWGLIFLLVTLQMSTSLRPILGRSEHFLTNEKKFFLVHWLETMGEQLAPRSEEEAPLPTREVTGDKDDEEQTGGSRPGSGGENPHLRGSE
ncbi:MAG: hypothetical protein ACQKBY_07855 [Verrucomicrobiales bacterium]